MTSSFERPLLAIMPPWNDYPPGTTHPRTTFPGSTTPCNDDSSLALHSPSPLPSPCFRPRSPPVSNIQGDFTVGTSVCALLIQGFQFPLNRQKLADGSIMMGFMSREWTIRNRSFFVSGSCILTVVVLDRFKELKNTNLGPIWDPFWTRFGPVLECREGTNKVLLA
jgi:hypothetical protein